MIKKNKRFVSVLLCISILSNSCIFTAAADCYEDCTQKNSNGQFVSICCAKEDAANKIKNGEHYIKMNNVGYNSDFTVYVSDYNNIEKVISELPYMSLKEIEEIFESRKKLDTIRTNAIKNWAKFSLKLMASTGFLLFSIIGRNKIGDYIANTYKFKKVVDYVNQKLNMNVNIDTMKKIIENTAIASATVIPVKVLSSTPGSIPKMNSIDYESIFNNNDNTFSAIKQVLSFIKYNFWKNNDALVIITNSNKNSSSSVASFSHYEINYTDEEKQEFENKFNSLKETLQAKVNQYKKEQSETYGEV